MDEVPIDVNLVGFGYSGGSRGYNIGCETFLEALLEHQPDLFASEISKPLHFKEIGNIKVDDKVPCKQAHETLTAGIEALDIRSPYIVVGGDHSISIPAIQHAKKMHGISDNKDLALIVFDAHIDTCAKATETHEDWLRYMIDTNNIASENVCCLGLRDLEPREYSYLNTSHINTYFMKDVFVDGIKETCKEIIGWAKNHKQVYCSVDVDAVDPSAAPGTGYPSPGGFTSREILYLLQNIGKLRNLCGVDVVEINPKKDHNGITLELGRKIIAEIGSARR